MMEEHRPNKDYPLYQEGKSISKSIAIMGWGKGAVTIQRFEVDGPGNSCFACDCIICGKDAGRQGYLIGVVLKDKDGPMKMDGDRYRYYRSLCICQDCMNGKNALAHYMESPPFPPNIYILGANGEKIEGSILEGKNPENILKHQNNAPDT